MRIHIIYTEFSIVISHTAVNIHLKEFVTFVTFSTFHELFASYGVVVVVIIIVTVVFIHVVVVLWKVHWRC